MQVLPQRVATELRQHIPGLVKTLSHQFQQEYTQNSEFRQIFDDLVNVCQTTCHVTVKPQAVKEMLLQHIMTARFFHLVFHDTTVLQYHPIARKIEAVLQRLPFDQQALLQPLDQVYHLIEQHLQEADWPTKRQLLSAFYEQFISVFSKEQVEQYGVIYTPPEVVRFMCQSVEDVLQHNFHLSLTHPHVKILDPCTGTGAFILTLMDLFSDPVALARQYEESLFCNEILLYPYYLASLTIEHEYLRRTGIYRPFQGICLQDTLQRDPTHEMHVPSNAERIAREREARLVVILGNPPYTPGRRQIDWSVDRRISETYSKDGRTAVHNHYYADYVRFLRWSTDRLQGHEGVICFITNNNFVTGTSLGGLRKHLAEEFTQIYHLDLGGNTRREPSNSNIMNGKVGLGITLLVRTHTYEEQKKASALIHYSQLEIPSLQKQSKKQTNEMKRAALVELGSIASITEQGLWQVSQLTPQGEWVIDQKHPEFQQWVPMGIDASRTRAEADIPALFRTYGGGIKTNQDQQVYHTDRQILTQRMHTFIDRFNYEVERQRHLQQDEPIEQAHTQDIVWNNSMQGRIQQGNVAIYTESWIRTSLYRPFLKRFLYFDPLFIKSRGQQPSFFPQADTDNVMIALPGSGNRKAFGCLAINVIADSEMGIEKALYFPYYIFDENGERQENISDWALEHFRNIYGSELDKHALFHYIYALLHHSIYRKKYASHLKNGLPRLPLVKSQKIFQACVAYGEQLLTLHLDYEHQEPASLEVVGKKYILPTDCLDYTIGNHPAGTWVCEQVNKGSLAPETLQRIITVSRKTTQIMQEIARIAPEESWSGFENREEKTHQHLEEASRRSQDKIRRNKRLKLVLLFGTLSMIFLFGSIRLWRGFFSPLAQRSHPQFSIISGENRP